MSRTSRRGRPQRQYRIRVRTERRDPIDYAALAQAALEQAAMNQRRDDDAPVRSTSEPAHRERAVDRRDAPAAHDETEGTAP